MISLRDRDWLKCQYTIVGKSTYQIAKDLGCSRITVSYWLRHHEIPVRGNWCPPLLKNHDWLYGQYVNQRKSAIQIAKDQGCSAPTVLKWLRCYDIPVRDQSEVMGCPPILRQRDWLYDQYVTQKKTMHQIAEDLGCSNSTVSNWLRHHNIHIRDRSEAQGLPQILRQRDWLEDQYVAQRKSAAQIADELGCSDHPIRNWLRRHGIHIRDNGGENSPHWRGGISFGPYCPKFNNQRKEQVRDQFGRKCLICGQPENGQRLCVHHVDYNKMQGCGHSWNLVPLCASCHAKTNGDRWYWFCLLHNWWACQPDINFTGSTFDDI